MNRRGVAVAALALLGVALSAGAASAATGQISGVQVAKGNRSISFTVDAKGLPAGAGLDPGSVVVEVGGRRVDARAIATKTDTTVVQGARVVLVVDTSGSMAGQPIIDARRAAAEFLAAVPPATQVGLVTFANTPHVIVPPTTDRSQVRAALTQLRAGGETSLYDAVRLALRSAGTSGSRRIVVLSDGGDTRSKAPLTTALAEVRHSGAVVEAVAFKTDEAATGTLQKLAQVSKGRVLRANNGRELADALVSTARTYATQLKVDALLPSQVWSETTPLTVRVESNAGPVTAGTAVRFPAAVVTTVVDPKKAWEDSTWLLTGGLIAVALTLILITVALASPALEDRRRMNRLVRRFTTKGAPQRETRSALADMSIAKTAMDLADKVAERKGRTARLSERLDRAAIAFTPGEWVLVQAGVTFAVGFLCILLGVHPLIAVIAAVGAGLGGTHLYISIKADRRQAAFVEQLPDTLQLLAGSLSAGYSLGQVMDGVVREGSAPMAAELGRALSESRLGVPLEEALDHVAERMQSEDFRWVVMAIRVQMEVGGNLAEVLTAIAATMRERVQMKRHVHALSAEGRLSAYILLALPLVLALYMVTLRRDYIEPLYTTPAGLVMIAAAFGFMTAGSIWMKKLVKVDY